MSLKIKPWQWFPRENSHRHIAAVIIFTQTSKINFYPLADSIENNFKEGGAMYISSPNVDDGYTPNNGTIYPWIDSEAQVKLNCSLVCLFRYIIQKIIHLNNECIICAMD